MHYPFQQVDVFSAKPCMGNPVAVFLSSEGLTTEDMQKIACWTNLSETTFVGPSDIADYHLRIFTPSCELPFAGHPTLGTAWALRRAGLITKNQIVQECAFGLVNVSFEDEHVFFQLPHYTAEPLGLDIEIGTALIAQTKNAYQIVTGPRWIISELIEPKGITELKVNVVLLKQLFNKLDLDGICVYSIRENAVHVRTFFEAGDAIVEDPVCGSGNAAVAVHIMKTGNVARVGMRYQAFQGAALKRDGRITVSLGDKIQIGGQCNTVFEGVAHF